jgi:putative ABC transport system substrate-binding protein
MGSGMRRRDFLAVLGGATAARPSTAWAQHAGKVHRIGYLSPTAGLGALDKAFLQGLRELGYVEGKNIVIEYRFAEGKFERLAGLAAELVSLDVGVIVAAVTQASIAAKAATSKIPVVILAVSDPLGSGLVTSLARPEANVTGTSSMTGDVVGKWLELLKEIVPGLSRVAVLWNPDNAIFQRQMLQSVERAGAVLGLQLRNIGARNSEEIDRTFETISKENIDALLVMADPTLIANRARIIDFAARRRLPAIYGSPGHAEDGGLISYSPDMLGQFHRAAAYVDRILKGAKPADLPIEQATKFELVINQNTAKALGLSIPLPLLGRADKVVE